MKTEEYKKIQTMIIEELKGLLESKTITNTELGTVTLSSDNETIYLDKYSELDRRAIKNFLKELKDMYGRDVHVTKSGSVTSLNFDVKFDPNDIENILNKL